MRIAAIAATLALGGCSTILSKPPQATPLHSLSECSASAAPPIADVVLAAVSGGIAVAGLGIAGLQKLEASRETVPSWDPHTTADANANTFLVVGLAAIPAAVGLTLSARHGFRSSRACRNARWDFMREPAPR